MLLSDNETSFDMLNNESIAASIVSLISESGGTPISIGVHGDWGAGKSSILEMIYDRLSQDNTKLCIKFNGWRYQGFEDAKIALMETVVKELNDRSDKESTLSDLIHTLSKSINWLKVSKSGLGLLANVHPIFGFARGALDYVDETPSSSKEKKESSSQGVVDNVETFRETLEECLKKAGIERLVILIDDLDRCLPKTAIETLEAVRLYLFLPNTAFVVAADEAMIQYAVKQHFPELPSVNTGAKDYSRNYLEKLIQVPFRIPMLGEFETKQYVSLLLLQSVIGETDPSFKNVVSDVRELLQKPWESTKAKDILQEFEGHNLEEEIRKMYQMSQIIGPMLTIGIQGNPRKIKRFVNSLLLRLDIATSKGFQDEINPVGVAKLMIAERFIPSLFGKIISDESIVEGGKCKYIQDLEGFDRGSPEQVNNRDAREVDWARLEPQLKDVDIRPYLLLARVENSSLYNRAKQGMLEEYSKLIARGKLTTAAILDKLELLTDEQAKSLYNKVESSVVSETNWRFAPASFEGLRLFVECRKGLLAEHYFNLLAQLVEKHDIGLWIKSGHVKALHSKELMQRFEQELVPKIRNKKKTVN